MHCGSRGQLGIRGRPIDKGQLPLMPQLARIVNFLNYRAPTVDTDVKAFSMTLIF